MTEQTIFIISYIPLFVAITLLRLSRNPRHLLLAAGLVTLSGILALILWNNYKPFSLTFFGLALFILWVRWYRKRWKDKKHR